MTTISYKMPSHEEVKRIRENTPVPDGYYRLPVGEVRQDGDRYLDTALFPGEWRPVNVLIGEPVTEHGAITIRKQ